MVEQEARGCLSGCKGRWRVIRRCRSSVEGRRYGRSLLLLGRKLTPLQVRLAFALIVFRPPSLLYVPHPSFARNLADAFAGFSTS